jgi:hypothetical protein
MRYNALISDAHQARTEAPDDDATAHGFLATPVP